MLSTSSSNLVLCPQRRVLLRATTSPSISIGSKSQQSLPPAMSAAQNLHVAPPEYGGFLEEAGRTLDFWRRTTTIYLSYKGAQARAFVLEGLGKSKDDIRKEVWEPQHQYAGDAMFDLCVTLRGFYLKAGQFIGSRNDFVPEPICVRLCRLCDKVPPMSGDMAGDVIKKELGISRLEDVFEWIDLSQPIGSASIAQVHKGKLRLFPEEDVKSARYARSHRQHRIHTVQENQSAWDVCNEYGMSLAELQKLNKGLKLNDVIAGQRLTVPASFRLDAQGHVQDEDGSNHKHASKQRQKQQESSTTASAVASVAAPSVGQHDPSTGDRAIAAVLQAQATGYAPEDGLVAVKVQYPNALRTMALDLKNLRAAAYYLSKTEIAFDLVSAVDELNKQIRLEFDFDREARVMDTIAHHLRDVRDHIEVPRSIPGLVTKRLLVMSFLQGVPLLEAGKKLAELSALKREQGKRRILERISEAYGRMLLGEGLFQADGHPGNILVSKGGKIGLLDYGQSKQLSCHHKLALAKLVVEMDRGDVPSICKAMKELGIITANETSPVVADIAYSMFDTRGKVNPFDPNTPIKKVAVISFPPDMFFVLRVTQLLRGMSNGMGINDFSCAHQWAPLARQAIHRAQRAADLDDEDKGSHVLSRVLKVALWPMPQLLSRLH